jgi:hypothetical protein
MKTSYTNIFRIAFTLFIFCYAILANYTYIIGGFNSPNDGIEFVVMMWVIAIYVGAISYHGYNDSYTWRSKHLSPTNICIGASIVGAIGSIGSLLLVSNLAFFVLFLLTSLMVMISLVLISSDGVKETIENGFWSCEMRRDLAKEFSRLLREELSKKEIVELNRRNIDYRLQDFKGICASHEFCDSNMTMDEAFENTFGFSPFESEFGLADGSLDLWNSAWTMAVNHELNEYKTL